MRNHKADFPIFQNHPNLVYLDGAATAQKPQVVIDAVNNFYTSTNANIHRGIYDLSQQATELFENTRKKVSDFIRANDPSEVIFTSGTTESINLVAFGLLRKYLQPGDVIVLSEMEHHSNIVPWMRLKEELGVALFFLPLDADFRLVYKDIPQAVLKKVRFVALTQVSNVLGTINPIRDIISFFKKQNEKILFLVDAAQSIPHFSLDVTDLGCDFLAFSSHKLYGPTGVGVLWGRSELLTGMDPLLVGSHMIQTVTTETALWAGLPDRFEAGTRNIEGVVGLGAAIDYVQRIGVKEIENYERSVVQYAVEKFSEQNDILLFGSTQHEGRTGVFSFVMKHIHPHDVAEVLNRKHIAVRAGHHCAQPLMQRLGVSGTVRISISLYNSTEDILVLMDGLEEVRQVFRR